MRTGPGTDLPSSYIQKYALWGAFNVTQAAILSPLLFMSPALLARAGLYTVGMMGSIAFVGATSKRNTSILVVHSLLVSPLSPSLALLPLSFQPPQHEH
jgi:growth hormone-inducible transmembrane protein